MMTNCGNGLGCQAAWAIYWSFSPVIDTVSASVRSIGDKSIVFWPLVAAIVGAVLASLSGVLVDRVPRIQGWNGAPEKNLSLAHPPSHCEKCHVTIPKLALIPVAGWVLTRGKCESCGSRVPWIYPVIEGGSALVSMIVVVAFGPTYFALCVCSLIWFSILVGWMDWREKIIPDGFTVPLAFVGLLASPFEPDAWARIAGAALAGMCFWTAFKIFSRASDMDAMAYGDVALGAASGAWIGFCATPAFLIASVLSYFVYAIPLRWKGQVWVPMGPAIAMGLIVIVVTGIRIQI